MDIIMDIYMTHTHIYIIDMYIYIHIMNTGYIMGYIIMKIMVD